MTKMEDRLKLIIQETNKDHQEKIEKQISGIFLFGFMIGIIFSYTGFLGYTAGVITGIMMKNKFSRESYSFIEQKIQIFYTIPSQIKKMLNIC